MSICVWRTDMVMHQEKNIHIIGITELFGEAMERFCKKE